MSILNGEEIRLGQELYQATSHWTPAGYEYQAKASAVGGTDSRDIHSREAQGSTGKRPRAIQGAGKGALNNKVRADKT